MKILQKKQQTMTILPESLDDLWCLSSVIDTDDILAGKTFRKVTKGNKETEKTNTIKKPMHLTIKVQKTEFSDTLKVLGTIEDGPEDVPRGEHHSFIIKPFDEITITKEWLSYQIEKIEEAVTQKKETILACIFNREEAILAKLEKNTFTPILTIKGNVSKKDIENTKTTDFFTELQEQLNQKIEQYNAKTIIIGSSHFWKNDFEKKYTKKDKVTYIYATITDVHPKALQELITSNEVALALKNEHVIADTALMEDFFLKIAKNEPITYGIKDTKEASESGRIDILMCSENYIMQTREEGTFKAIEEIFKTVENLKGKIHILSGNSEAQTRLDGLGGICAILRY